MPFVIYADFEATTETCKPEKISHTQKHIRNTQIVDVVIKLFVVMMVRSASSCRYAEEKIPFTSLSKKCQKKLRIAKRQPRSI